MKTREAIKRIYDERKDFIIIGLTGRTGSGCTTAAEILKKSDFKELHLKSPKSHDFNDSEEIKYSKIYKYVSDDNWNGFEVITMSDLIVSFIIEKGYECFEGYLYKTFKEVELNDKEELIFESISELKSLIDSLKAEMDGIDYEELKDDSSDKIYSLYMNREKNPRIAKELKEKLKKFNCKVYDKDSQLYTFLFQRIGNNLRSSGNPYEPEFEPDKFFTIAERANSVIKAIRKKNKEKNKEKSNEKKKPTLICIDAIRNPFEATFFKDRYSAFYLISVNTDDDSRISRLSDLRQDEIKSLDEREYPKMLRYEQNFYNQNISACLEIADIHLYNPNIDNEKYYFLTEQLLKYYVLMIYPGLITPTHIERCMQIAYNTKLNSGCLSRQVGSVVTGPDYSIKSVGWNEVPKGQVSCSLRDLKEYMTNNDRESYSCYEITNKSFCNAMNQLDTKVNYNDLGGRKYAYCFKDVYNALDGKGNQVHTRSLHAEENAFLQISKYGGEGVSGGFLFVTASPCELCAKKAYQLGISKIYYIDPYPGISSTHILNFGSTGNPKMELFYGAIGNAYISLYTPRIAYKDELEMITGFNIKEFIMDENERKVSKYPKWVNFVLTLKEKINSLPLKDDEKGEMKSDIKTIDVQLKSPNPKEQIIIECCNNIKSTLEKLIESALAKELEELFMKSEVFKKYNESGSGEELIS